MGVRVIIFVNFLTGADENVVFINLDEICHVSYSLC